MFRNWKKMTSLLLVLFIWSGIISAGKVQDTYADELVRNESESQSVPLSNNSEFETVTTDFSNVLLQTGGLPSIDEIQLQSDNTELEKFIYNALMKSQEIIDISSFNLPLSGFSALWMKIINNNPDLFHVSGWVSYSHNNSIVLKITPVYIITEEELIEQRNRLDIEVDKIREIVKPWMSDLEIALVVNDYLALNTTYDYDNLLNNTIPNDSRTVYGTLVEKTAVCQGYALTYAYLMNNIFGIPTEYVVSNAMNHAWNMVMIDGHYYHVDVTWNDPVRDMLGQSRHFYFLLSDSEMLTREHYGWVSPVKAENKKFDEMFWENVDSPFARIVDKYYYINNYTSDLMEWDYGKNSHRVVKNLSERWPSSTGGTWRGAFSRIYASRGVLYLSMPDGIYSIHSDGSDYKKQFSSDTSNYQSPFGFFYKDDVFKYVLSDTPSMKGKESIKVAAINLGQKAQSITLDTDDFRLNVDDVKKVTATIEPYNAVNHEIAWISSDTDVAKVSDGSVTGLSEGTAIISAITYDGDKVAEVKVTVGKAISEKVLSEIRVISAPSKTSYVVGQELDLTGLKVEGTYSDGSKVIIPVTMSMATGFNSTQPMIGQNVTITIDKKTVSFKVDIIAKTLKSIKTVKLPAKTKYFVGETLDLEGLKVEGTYNDDTIIEISRSLFTASGFDSSKQNKEQKITLTLDSFSIEYYVEILSDPVKVLAGDNRFSTATSISRASYDKADIAILVQSDNFPDALSAGPLAYALNAPILLTNTSRLSSTTQAELKRLGVKKVIIMGGESAVSSNVEKELEALYYSVERIAGNNRYNTAVEVAYNLKDLGGSKTSVVLASGNNFADALSAGSYAAKNGIPILLTNGKLISDQTMKYIREEEISSIVLVGGNIVIEESVVDLLEKENILVTRVAGNNRADTSVAVGTKYFGSSGTVIAANGLEFADALAAAPYAAKINAPILLVYQNRMNSSIESYLSGHDVKNIIVVGGENAVGSLVKDHLTEIILNNK